MKPSTRSITPPWPGMSWLESLTPKRRLIQDFEQIAGLRQRRRDQADPQEFGRRRLRPRAEDGDREAEQRAADDADDRAGPGLAGRDARPELGPADQPAAEIGHHIGAPDDGEQPGDGERAEIAASGAAHSPTPPASRRRRGRAAPRTAAPARPAPLQWRRRRARPAPAAPLPCGREGRRRRRAQAPPSATRARPSAPPTIPCHSQETAKAGEQPEQSEDVAAEIERERSPSRSSPPPRAGADRGPRIVRLCRPARTAARPQRVRS